MSELPQGTVTLLFSDIEGSTRLLDRLGDRYAVALSEHRAVVRDAFTRHGGVEVGTEGDSFFVAFARAEQAVLAAVHAQQAFASHSWPDGAAISVRIGIHTGVPELDGSDYVGMDVHRAARVMAAGHGGQVLLTHSTVSLLPERLPSVSAIRPLGSFCLKDMTHADRLYQVVIDGLRSEFPPLLTAHAQLTSLPIQPTSFVGRARELAEVSAELQRDNLRLLTLTGPGGSGKTRLAIEAAATRAGDFQHGVRFIPFASVVDTQLLAPTLVRSLGLAEREGAAAEELLLTYLAHREMLLVLDNLEQLAAGTVFLAELLAECPGLKLLATSRSPLHLAWEYEYPVPPLDENEAVQLFRERARAVNRNFSANGEVAEICRRLDALPLAIELAAARTRSFSAAEILARLDGSLQLLAHGPRDALDRHQTLRATIAWSHDLLDAEEQRLFARLAVFSGGCTAEAAEAVCGNAVEMLDVLVDRSLLRHDAGRYRMLGTIREYAVERFATFRDAEAVHGRHANYFLRLAEEAAPELRRSDNDRIWLDALAVERANFGEALRWLIGRGDGANAQRLVSALFVLWHDRGPVSEGWHWFERALELPATRRQRARTLAHGAVLAKWSGADERAGEWAKEARTLARETADPESAATALQVLGISACSAGRREEGEALLAEALAAARETADDWVVAGAICTLVNCECAGDYASARALAEEAGRLRTVSSSARSLVQASRGKLAGRHGDVDAAVALLRESLAAAQAVRFDKSFSLLGSLGWYVLQQGNISEATTLLTESVELADESGDRGWVAGSLAYLAVATAAQGDSERAAMIRGAVESYRRTVGDPPLDEFALGTFDEFLAEARSSAGADRWAEALARGSALSLDEAAQYALEKNTTSI